MFAGVTEIYDLNRAREVLIGIVPNPFRTIANHDFLLGTGRTAVPGFEVNSKAELVAGFDSAGIGSGLWL